MREIVRIRRVGDPIVGVGDDAFGWIVKTRQLVELDETGPVVALVPTVRRQERRRRDTPGDFPGESVADVSFAVGVDKVQARRRVKPERVFKLTPVARAIEVVEALEFPARFLRYPSRGEDFLAVERGEIADHRTVAAGANDFLQRPAAAHGDPFSARLERLPAIADQIKLGIDAVRFLAVDFHVVAQGRGDAPGNKTIVADLDARNPGNRCAPDFIAVRARRTFLGAQMYQIPD